MMLNCKITQEWLERKKALKCRNSTILPESNLLAKWQGLRSESKPLHVLINRHNL